MSPHTFPALGILVVDDDAAVRASVVRTLADLGPHTLHTAVGAREALQRLDQTGATIDVVICDLQMPDGDGYELFRGLAQRGHAARAILMTGAGRHALAQAENLDGSLGLAIVDRLEKPVNVAALRHALDMAVNPEPRRTTATHEAATDNLQLPSPDVSRFAHDAASPLLAINVLSEMLLEGELTPDQRKDVEQIRGAADQLTATLAALRRR